eukprot:753572-Hanusia_phi.AAC.16
MEREDGEKQISQLSERRDGDLVTACHRAAHGNIRRDWATTPGLQATPGPFLERNTVEYPGVPRGPVKHQ